MELIDKSEAAHLLVNELPLISACVRGAWDDYQDYPVQTKVLHSPRTRASLIHDHMVARARHTFDIHLNAVCQDLNRMFVVFLHDRIALRFKKFDDDYRSSNIPTQQSLDFVRQQMTLPEYPAVTNLQAGYRLNALGTELDGIYLICPNGKDNHWILDVQNTQKASNVFEFPTTATQLKTVMKLRQDYYKTGEEDEKGS